MSASRFAYLDPNGGSSALPVILIAVAIALVVLGVILGLLLAGRRR